MASSPNSFVDTENPCTADEKLEGFADFAAYIGSDRDLALFRRFDTLGARNLLYLQAELLALEEQLQEYDEEDRIFVEKNSTREAEGQLMPNGPAWEVLPAAKDFKSFARRAKVLEHQYWLEIETERSGTESNELDSQFSGKGIVGMVGKDDRQRRKMLTILKIREVLKEYHEALVLHSQVLQLESPGSRPLKVFQEWFNIKRPFMHKANDLYMHKDVVALRPSPAQDRLSKILQKRAGWAFREKRALPPSWGKPVFYSAKKLARAVQMLTVLFAAFALTSAIICLHYMQTTAQRFGALGAFLFVFVLAIGMFTTAKTSEMLGATAAYGAVLVVFIATGLPKD
ncbi:hypothetical protein BKA65DRAFT_478476 [Rhexocercosporidium sp. MPI-PUGE-AT-0058]|nr:hypothetical protein BKA65DRAFT_478476 [Rhexocercosporidium sp. MPI-PUGE-AT-0058]